MASTLPTATPCCDPCDSPSTVQVPGPAGADGAAGAAGAAGASAFTTVTIDFTMPGELASVVATVGSTTWMAIGMILWVTRADASVKGFMEVTAIGGATSVTLKNLKDTSTSAYLTNSAAGTVNVGSKVVAAGKQGASRVLTGAAGGDLAGTYPNPTLAEPSAKGSILVGNATVPVAMSAGTDGQLPTYDAAIAHGATPKTILPLSAAGDDQDNRILRLDASSTKPLRGQGSKVEITDNGSVRTTGGDARGSEAVDLQATRSGTSQVASGANAVIGGGTGNTASAASAVAAGGSGNSATGTYAAVAGGIGNGASGSAASVGGGSSNSATALDATVGGGNANLARSESSFVGGGDGNIAGDAGAANKRCTVAGGQDNEATGQESTVGGGSTNQATATQATVAGGDSNLASGAESFIGGGGSNIASGLDSVVAGGQDNEANASYASVPGGLFGKASQYGQMARASGRFAADGDAQYSEAIARRATTDATPSELFLDGSATRLVVPNNTSWMFQIMLTARTSAGLTAIYKSEGAIENNAGTTTSHSVTTTEIYDGASLPATPVVVDHDDPNNALRITVTGIAATNIRWVAHVRLVEVAY